MLVERPVVWGSVSQYGGQVGLSWAERGPQYRDLFPVEPDDADALTCEVGGVLPTVVATVGSLMATEAIKVITGIGEPLLGRVIVLDALGATFDEVRYERTPERVAEENPTRTPKPDGATPLGTRSEAPPRKGIGNGLLAEDNAHAQTGGHHEPARARPRRSRALPRDHAGRSSRPSTATCCSTCASPGRSNSSHWMARSNIPLGQLEQRVGELDPTMPVIAYCHHGVRSEQARRILEANGFDVRHLAGGIDAWSREIDPELRRY